MSQSMSKAEAKAGKKKNELLETIIVIIEALAIALIFRTFLYQPFSIPTASMQQTLMIGDYFVANKWVWGFGKYSFPIALPFNGRLFGSEPQRGDVAVFRNEITNEDYIKRVIGMPGDRIQMKAGRLYINGTMVEREQIGTAEDTDSYMTTVPVTVYTETLPKRRQAHHPGNLRRPAARQHRRVRRSGRAFLHDGRQPRSLRR
jgi:signal peptidase I